MAANRKLFYRDEALERFYAEKSDYSESEDNFGLDEEGEPLGEISDEEDIVTNQSSDILQHSQNRPTGDRWLKF